jgi:DNA-binding response OmpR family regulator
VRAPEEQLAVHVVLVHEDPRLAQDIRRYLSRRGCEVVPARTADEVISAVEDHVPDVLLVDWEGHTGETIEAAHRALPEHPFPILVVLAEQDPPPGLPDLPCLVLRKPVHGVDLVGAIRVGALHAPL